VGQTDQIIGLKTALCSYIAHSGDADAFSYQQHVSVRSVAGVANKMFFRVHRKGGNTGNDSNKSKLNT
jgi:hypothetical protein